MKELANKKLYVLDMDGTIYLGSHLFPETIPFLERVKAHASGISFLPIIHPDRRRHMWIV